MKIKRGESYIVDLKKEPPVITDHKKIPNGALIFTGAELIKAIVSAGMPDVYLTKAERRNRREEIHFKTKLFETFVTSSAMGYLSFDTSKKNYLDSSEVGAINYWIGMMLTTLLGQKKYGYTFMVHLSMVKFFSSKIYLNSYSSRHKIGNVTYMSPDLLAVNRSKNKYGVFESKGYSSYGKKAMEHAYEQAKWIHDINGNLPNHRLAVMTITGGKEISIIEKDPEGGNYKLNVDLDILYLYHFLPIAELIMELDPKERGERTFGTLEYGDDRYSISIPSGLYRDLSRILDIGKESFSDESVFKSFISELHSSYLISEEMEGGILRVE